MVNYLVDVGLLVGGENVPLQVEADSNQVYWKNTIVGGKDIVLTDDNAEFLQGLNKPYSSYFIWGTSIFGDNSNFVFDNQEIYGVVSSTLSSTTIGEYGYPLANSMQFTIDTTSLRKTDNFMIFFDPKYEIYGTRIIVEDLDNDTTQTFTNDSFQFRYIQDVETSSLRVTISHTNVGGYPLIVLAITNGLSLILTPNKSLKDVDYLQSYNFDKTNIDDWRIITSSGNINFFDINDTVKSVQEERGIFNDKDINVKMLVNNTETTIASYIGDIDYTGQINSSIKLEDKLSRLNDKKLSAVAYSTNKTAYSLLQEVLPSVETVLGESVTISATAQAFMQTINVGKITLDEQSLFDRLNNILYISLSKLLKIKNEYVIILKNYTDYSNESTVYRINESQTIGKISSSFNKKYDTIAYTEVTNTNGTIAKNEIVVGDSTIKYSLISNNLMCDTTLIGNTKIGTYIANKIIENEIGLQLLELEMPRVDLYAYDRSGNKLSTHTDSTIGEFLQLGNFVEIYDDINGRYKYTNENKDCKVFEVIGVNFAKTTKAPTFKLVLKEIVIGE